MEISSGRRSYAKGLATREEILDGALPLVNELGDRATLDVLVRELGLTKGRLTHHFPTKDKLLDNGARWEAEIARNLELDAPYR